MALFGFPILGGLLGLTSAVAPAAAIRTGAGALATAKSVYDQVNLGSNATFGDRLRAALPFGIGSLFQKPTPFFDPGLGSPPPAPPGEITPPSSRPPVTVENLPPPPGTIARPPPIQDVTRENLPPPESLPGIPSEADFSAGFDFGTGFGFNQGGLVSLLPRFQNGGEVSFRQRQRPLGFKAPLTPAEAQAQYWADVRERVLRDPSERTHPAVRILSEAKQYLQHQANKSGSAPMWLGPAAAASKAGLIGGSKFFPPAALAFSLKDQLFDMPPGSSVRDRVMKFLPEILTKTLGYEKLWPVSKEPAPFFDPGFGSPPPAPPGEGSPPTDSESHAAGSVSLPGIPSEEEVSAGFNLFNQGGLVSLLPRRATPVRSPPISYRRY